MGNLNIPPPTADYCWEGRLITTILLLCVLYVFMSLRVKAVYGLYSSFTPRGLSGAFVAAATILCTIYTGMVIWNYTVWFRIRGLYEHSVTVHDEEVADDLLPIIRSLVPESRKEVAFSMRMMLVTVLWCVKASFIMVYYAFAAQLPPFSRFLLYGTTSALFVSYIGIWVITAMDMQIYLELEGYSPAAGAGVVLFTPPNTWSTWAVSDDVLAGKHPEIPSLLVVECIITSLNAGTDAMLIVLVYSIFRHLSLARGRNHLRSMMLLLVLSSLSIVIAIVRFGIMMSGMEHINHRLAFDSLTEFESFIAACAACIPAMRVLARGGGNKLEFGFPENWGSLGSRFSRSVQNTFGGTKTGRDSLKPLNGTDTPSTLHTLDDKEIESVSRPTTARTISDWEVERFGAPDHAK
ncbi:Similar to hypothetical protein [Tuber melanosporum Mel28]; acc. no. XP_002837329 [Pyronema omphalodes CBS 100304]|uniref:Uncharacterized protein n=1 Tax=Pyronema omphalodes (strain CBS 100304) TaxID=1076935 RepID=U4L5R2_PYROM|nr:Similar to hypothetical protein [Tuber melanosporum Mel28]; acc. no. XP_002837329 [Pyronema omphalodes CBS 100304]